MSTVQEMIQQTRTMVQPQSTASWLRVNGAVSDSATSITFDQTLTDVGVVYGSVLSPEDSDERILVMAASGSTTSDVVRGHESSTAAAIADNAMVRVNEPFDNKRILDALNEESWHLASKGVAVPETVEFEYDARVRGYVLPQASESFGNSLKVLQVVASTPDTYDKSWVRLRHWHTVWGMDAAEFSTGAAIMIDEPWTDGEKIRVTFQDSGADAGSASFTSLSTDAWNIPFTAEALLRTGAAIRLLEQEEGRRNQLVNQDDPRSAQQTPPGAFASGIQLMRRTYANMLRDEMAALRQRYPDLDWEART